MTKDPVCNAQVNERTAEHHHLKTDYDGETFYFCSADCKKSFDAKPLEFATKIRWPEDWNAQDTDEAYQG